MATQAERTDVVIEHYTKMLEELMWDANALGNSKPLSRMTASIMAEKKETTLARIADLTGFLDTLKGEVEKIDTRYEHPDYCLCDECAAFRYAVTGEPD